MIPAHRWLLRGYHSIVVDLPSSDCLSFLTRSCCWSRGFTMYCKCWRMAAALQVTTAARHVPTTSPELQPSLWHSFAPDVDCEAVSVHEWLLLFEYTPQADDQKWESTSAAPREFYPHACTLFPREFVLWVRVTCGHLAGKFHLLVSGAVVNLEAACFINSRASMTVKFTSFASAYSQLLWDIWWAEQAPILKMHNMVHFPRFIYMYVRN